MLAIPNASSILCPRIVRAWQLIGMIMIALITQSAAKAAGASSIEGNWRGGGRVLLSSGAEERARCHARFTMGPDNLVRMQAKCATSSFGVTQTAELRKAGALRYEGAFFNAEYNVSGSIEVVLTGGVMRAVLFAPGGTAELRFHR